MLRAGVALVPEHRRLFANLTVDENLKMGGATASAGKRAERIVEMARAVSRAGRQGRRRGRLPVGR